MHNSVESRTPYLSPQFVSSCLTNKTMNAKPELFRYLLPKNIFKLLDQIPKEGFSPDSSYKKHQVKHHVSNMSFYKSNSIPDLTRFSLFNAVYHDALPQMPGLQRLNALCF